MSGHEKLTFADGPVEDAPLAPWKILVADDDESIHLVTKLALSGMRAHSRPLELLHAYSGSQAVDVMRENTDVALVLMDVVMDNEHDGLDAVQRIRKELKNSFVRIVVRTGQPGQAPERKVVADYDINDYREKTELTAQKLFTVIHTGVGYYSQLRTLDEHSRNVRQGQRDLVFMLSEIIEERSPETVNHVRRVSAFGRLVAELLGKSGDECGLIEVAMATHDIGKISVPEAILHKPGQLTADEWTVMQTHAAKGAEMLAKLDGEIVKAAAVIAAQHHEKWDGTGYPNRLGGENIHLYGRIAALIDVFDALSNDRCYKAAWPLEQVVAFIRQGRGKHFDPALVDLLVGNLDRFVAIQKKFADVPSVSSTKVRPLLRTGEAERHPVDRSTLNASVRKH